MERMKFFGRMYVNVKNSTAPISWMVSTIIQISIYYIVQFQTFAQVETG